MNEFSHLLLSAVVKFEKKKKKTQNPPQKNPNILAGDFNLHTDEPYCIFKYFFNIAKANMGVN